MDIHPERIRLGIHVIRLRRVVELLEDLPRPNAPPFVLDGDKSRGMIMGLEQIGAVHVGGEVGGDELSVLAAAGLGESRQI